ncbi:MAG: hypothetical protein GY696_19275, partial [Gammaproteobacteria bacterium]|nr:hypothetical protein [Gammaproteobacteria bacterium]
MDKSIVSLGSNDFHFESPYAPVYCHKKRTIPAHCGRIVFCKIQRQLPEAIHTIFEPDAHTFNGVGLQSCPSVGEVKDQNVPILHPNTSNPIHVKRHKIMGMCRTLIPQQIEARQESPPVLLTQTANPTTILDENSNEVKENTPDDHPHIKPMTDLTPTQMKTFDLLVKEFSDVFSHHDGDLGRTSVLKHTIDTGSATPIRQKSYPVPFSQRESIAKHIAKMKEQGVITESQSSWA